MRMMSPVRNRHVLAFRPGRRRLVLRRGHVEGGDLAGEDGHHLDWHRHRPAEPAEPLAVIDDQLDLAIGRAHHALDPAERAHHCRPTSAAPMRSPTFTFCGKRRFMIASGELSTAVSCPGVLRLSGRAVSVIRRRRRLRGAGSVAPLRRIGALPAAGPPRTTTASPCLCYSALGVHTTGGSTPRRGAFRCLPGRPIPKECRRPKQESGAPARPACP